jgi:hypothetical protein
LNHGIFICVKENTERDIDRGAKDLIPSIKVVLITRESINQEALFVPSMLFHTLLQQLACNLYWNDLSLNDALVDQSSSI